LVAELEAALGLAPLVGEQHAEPRAHARVVGVGLVRALEQRERLEDVAGAVPLLGDGEALRRIALLGGEAAGARRLAASLLRGGSLDVVSGALGRLRDLFLGHGRDSQALTLSAGAAAIEGSARSDSWGEGPRTRARVP